MSNVKIEMTLKDVTEAAPALRKLMGCAKMGAKTKYHAAKLGRLFQTEMDIYEEKRQEMVKEMSTERDATEAEQRSGMTPRIFSVPPEKLEEFKRRHKELLDVKVEIAWSPFPFEELPDDLDAIDIMTLGALLTEPR